jgi:hypothetical protein
MEAFIVTVFPALLWDWLAWKVYRRLTPRIGIVSILPISALAFFGFFATTLYISHGRIMTVPEGACVSLGLFLLNALIVASKRT